MGKVASRSRGNPRQGQRLGASATTASAADGGGEAAALGGKRPEYLVLFRERSERNLAAIADTLGVRETPGVSARASRTILSGRHETDARPRVYPALRVAALDLTPDDRATLARHQAVATIVRNEVRRLPPFFDEPAHAERAGGDASPSGPFAAAPATRMPLAPVELLQGSDPLTAYLHGLCDAAGLAIQAAQARRLPTPGGPPLLTLPSTLADPAWSWCLAMIGLNPGYARATGKGVRVAVLDTGVDLTHPDLQGRFAGGNDTESFVGTGGVQDGNGHGTHCAGVIGGRADPAGGRRYGVAPDVELVIGKVLSDAGSGTDDRIIDGIDWAANVAQARIISMSLGSPRQRGAPYADAYEVIAESLLESPGVVIVAAAGNESARPGYVSPVGNPAACPSIFAVAAVDQFRQVAPYSCGQLDAIGAVDFSGPGSGVYSSWTGGGYRTISGTSMATPHAAAALALYAELDGTLAGATLVDRLRQRCAALGPAETFGAGLVQVPA